MSKKTLNKIKKGGSAAIVVILILIACYALSWICTCGVIKLITMCFGLTFKWNIATGIWLVICIIKSIFSKSKGEEDMLTNEQRLGLFKNALDTFETEEHKKFAEDVFMQMPENSIILPSSSSLKYHNATQCEIFGNLKHILMVGSICNYLIGLEQNIKLFPTSSQRDCLRIAAYCHDGVKYGWNNARYTQFNHPILSSEWIKNIEVEHDIPEADKTYIGDLIASHSGEWTTSNRSKEILPSPMTDGEKLIHMCDYLSSRADIDMTYSDELLKLIEEIVNDWKDNFVMGFGKYNGMSVKEVYQQNSSYFQWLEDKGGVPEPYKTIISLLEKE